MKIFHPPSASSLMLTISFVVARIAIIARACGHFLSHFFRVKSYDRIINESACVILLYYITTHFTPPFPAVLAALFGCQRPVCLRQYIITLKTFRQLSLIFSNYGKI